MHVFLSPLGLGLLGLLSLGLLRRAGYRHAGRWLALPLATCLLLMTPLGANTLLRLVEVSPADAAVQQATCQADPSRPLVLLGGGLRRPARTPEDLGALSEESLQRVLALNTEAPLRAGQLLVISGGGEPGTVPEGAVLRQAALHLGIPATQIRLEDRAQSTWENAVRTAELLPGTRRVTVLTSALHMARAAQAFRRHGFDVCLRPVASEYVPPALPGYLLPQSSALNKSERAIHEGVGALVYRIRDALRPDASRAGRGS